AVFCLKAEDGIRDWSVTGVQTCALPILPVSEGLMVLRVVPGSGADKAGMRNAEAVGIRGTDYTVPLGDVITKVDGKTISQQDDLDRVLNSKNVGDHVQVEIVRNGRRMTLDVQLTD